MSQPLQKKEIAALIHTSTKTMRRHREQYAWVEGCRLRRPGRPTYDRQQVETEARRRGVIGSDK